MGGSQNCVMSLLHGPYLSALEIKALYKFTLLYLLTLLTVLRRSCIFQKVSGNVPRVLQRLM